MTPVVNLKDQSDIYPVKADGTPDTSGTPYPTSISTGGTWTTCPPAGPEVGRFTRTGAGSSGARKPLSSLSKSKPSGSVVTTGQQLFKIFNDVTVAPGTVGFLSDYFGPEQGSGRLTDEAQEGGNPVPRRRRR